VTGPVLGLAWSLLGIPLPHLAQVSLTEIGSVTAGLALFLTGLVLSAQTIEISGNALTSTLLTVVVRPVFSIDVPPRVSSGSSRLPTRPWPGRCWRWVCR
jgi:malonate transporter and related proteins